MRIRRISSFDLVRITNGDRTGPSGWKGIRKISKDQLSLCCRS